MSIVDAVSGVLGSVSGGSGDSTSERLFGAGKRSLQTGSYVPIVLAIVNEFLSVGAQQSDPSAVCVYQANPLEIPFLEGTGDLANFWRSGVPLGICTEDVWYEKGGGYTECIPWWVMGTSGAVNYGPPDEARGSCRDRDDPSFAVSYRFDDLWNMISGMDLSEIGTRPGGYVMEKDHAWWRKIIFGTWKILGRTLAFERYKLEVEPVITRMISSTTDPAKRLAIEQFYQGRIVDGQWRWGTEELAGVPLSLWPLWIPVDTSALLIRKLYALAFFDLGIDDTTLEILARFDPITGIAVEGTSIEGLSPTDQKRYIARATAIAGAKARGNAQSYDAALRRLEAVQESLGFCRTLACGPGQTSFVDEEDIRQALVELLPIALETSDEAPERIRKTALAVAQKQGKLKGKGRTGLIVGGVLALSAALGVGVSLWSKRRKKKKRRRKKR